MNAGTLARKRPRPTSPFGSTWPTTHDPGGGGTDPVDGLPLGAVPSVTVRYFEDVNDGNGPLARVSTFHLLQQPGTLNGQPYFSKSVDFYDPLSADPDYRNPDNQVTTCNLFYCVTGQPGNEDAIRPGYTGWVVEFSKSNIEPFTVLYQGAGVTGTWPWLGDNSLWDQTGETATVR